ncbi:hypothetical protein [Streptomyces sp. NPDC006334]|uniref:hypothetical protein n=1 Tax=Streptomyces sp. NPDC006334 TaxID=3156754 RepID=UPI0033AAD536
MRSLLAAILTLFLPPRGAHRALALPSPPFAQWPALAPGARLRPADVILADGLPLVRPYLATLGQCHVTSEAAA